MNQAQLNRDYDVYCAWSTVSVTVVLVYAFHFFFLRCLFGFASAAAAFFVAWFRAKYFVHNAPSAPRYDLRPTIETYRTV